MSDPNPNMLTTKMILFSIEKEVKCQAGFKKDSNGQCVGMYKKVFLGRSVSEKCKVKKSELGFDANLEVFYRYFFSKFNI